MMARVLFSLCLALAISCGTPSTSRDQSAINALPTTAQASPASATTVPTNTPAAAVSPTLLPTVAPAAAPTLAPTGAPTIARTAAPTPRPATPAPVVNLCGAAANPWNYTFCSGSFITNPPSAFCSYFTCIASFATGNGYVMQCVDTTFGKSGGISGSCSGHGGNSRALYAP